MTDSPKKYFPPLKKFFSEPIAKQFDLCYIITMFFFAGTSLHGNIQI